MIVAVTEYILVVTFLLSTESGFLPHLYLTLGSLEFVSNIKVAPPIQHTTCLYTKEVVIGTFGKADEV